MNVILFISLGFILLSPTYAQWGTVTGGSNPFSNGIGNPTSMLNGLNSFGGSSYTGNSMVNNVWNVASKLYIKISELDKKYSFWKGIQSSRILLSQRYESYLYIIE